MLSPDNTFIYVTCNCPPSNQSPDLVKVFNSSNLMFTKNIPVVNNPLMLKFIPEENYVNVFNKNSNLVSVIIAINQTVVKTIRGVGIQPYKIDFTHYTSMLSYHAVQPIYVDHRPQVDKVK